MDASVRLPVMATTHVLGIIVAMQLSIYTLTLDKLLLDCCHSFYKHPMSCEAPLA